MKKSKILLMLLPILLGACSTERSPENVNVGNISYRLNVSGPTKFNFGYNTDLSASFRIESDNTGWQVSGVPTSWLSVLPTEGRTTTNVALKAQENKSVDEARVAFLKVQSTEKNYNYQTEISVSQSMAEVYIVPSEKSIICSASATENLLSVSSNVEWIAECSESWIALKKQGNNQLLISIAENLDDSRKAVINLKRLGKDVVTNHIDITQSEAGVTTLSEIETFNVNGETKNITISVDASWTAYTSDPSWLMVSPESGSNGKVNLSITALLNGSSNPRSGIVYVKIGQKQKAAIPIRQEGVSIILNKESLVFASIPDNKSFDVTSNTSWTVLSSPDWMELSPRDGGIGTTNVLASVGDNPNTTSLKGTIVIGREGITERKSIPVEQKGKYFYGLVSELEFPNTESTQGLIINTDGAWEATTNDSWIELKKDANRLYINVKANPDKDPRDGNVKVAVGQTVQSVKIKQKGRYVNYKLQPLLKNSKDASIVLSIESNMDWSLSSNEDWLNTVPSEGHGDANVIINVGDNASAKERDAILSIITADETKYLVISQPGRTLTLDCEEMEFFSDGGSSQTVTITTDGQYEISCLDEWIEVHQNSNTFTLTVAKNKGTGKREGSIVISLTDLKNGEELKRTLTVKQLPLFSIDFNDYEEDENWN